MLPCCYYNALDLAGHDGEPGHTDGGELVMTLQGYPAEAGARARVLAAWDAVPIGLGAILEQVA
ncbi:MAG TPA: hypothetical protein VNY35_06925 [Solirubrobacteraceae bacterium]|jgi:hypothetical protein|nr:hypothetical protein [Solirubrobacteraceae bacterium]